MPRPPTKAEQDAHEEAMRLSRLVSAYKRVFGCEGRTSDQQLVWDDLQKAGYGKKPAFVPDKDGKLCPLRAAIAEGRRSLILYVEANVTATLASPEQQPTGR